MAKVKSKKNNNFIALNTSGQKTLDNPEYSQAIKELYGKIIYTLNGLNNRFCPSFSKEKFIDIIKKLSHDNMLLADEYYEKYLEAMQQSDEIYREYELAIKNNDENYTNDLSLLDEKFNNMLEQIDNDFAQFQQESFAKYKSIENTFDSM